MESNEKYSEHRNGDNLRLDYKGEQMNHLGFIKHYNSKLGTINNKLNLFYNTLISHNISDLLSDTQIIPKGKNLINGFYHNISDLESATLKEYDKLCKLLSKEKKVKFDDISISIEGVDLDIMISDMASKLKRKVDALEDVLNGLNHFMGNGNDKRILSSFDDIKTIEIE